MQAFQQPGHVGQGLVAAGEQLFAETRLGDAHAAGGTRSGAAAPASKAGQP